MVNFIDQPPGLFDSTGIVFTDSTALRSGPPAEVETCIAKGKAPPSPDPSNSGDSSAPSAIVVVPPGVSNSQDGSNCNYQLRKRSKWKRLLYR